MPLQLTYYYSACIKIATCGQKNNTTILCDPWFTEPIYHGSWYQYPPYEYDAIQQIGDIDFVFVSHIHPDHYDPVFLKKYFDYYGNKPILIQNRPKNFLLSKMRRDGFSPIPTDLFEDDSVCIKVIPIQPSNIYQIDSALVVKSIDGHSIVNLNDCNYDNNLVNEIENFCNHQIDICLLNYTPASSYPQSYNFSDERMQLEKSRVKSIYKKKFLKFKSSLHPKLAIPFAGQYILGGKNYLLNQNLGVCDAVELVDDSNDIAVLETNTSLTTDCLSNRIERRECYNLGSIISYSKKLSNIPYDYELNQSPNLQNTFESLYEPLRNCLRSKEVEPFTLCLISSDLNTSYVAQYTVDSNTYLDYKIHSLAPLSAGELFAVSKTYKNDLIDYLCIYLEPKLLQAVLAGQIHWNNIYVASLALYDRHPLHKHRKDVFELLSLMRPMPS